MSKTTIPTTWRNCATCRCWTGTAIPNAFRSFVEVYTNERGKCMGGGFNLGTMSALQSCTQHDPRW